MDVRGRLNGIPDGLHDPLCKNGLRHDGEMRPSQRKKSLLPKRREMVITLRDFDHAEGETLPVRSPRYG